MESPFSGSLDKQFLVTLKYFIDSELSFLKPNELSKERYIIFQNAFNQVWFLIRKKIFKF